MKQIIKKRTDYEYTIIRPELTINEYQEYLQYEITLDKLREIRSKKIVEGKTKEQLDQIRSIRSSFIQHIHYIFQRAIRRFPSEMGLWDAHIAFLQSKESTKFLDTVFGKALSLFPKNIDFWIKAASHELQSKQNFHAARVLLQRALRVNSKNNQLWAKYFELELWNVLRVKERRRILLEDLHNNPSAAKKIRPEDEDEMEKLLEEE